MGAISQGGRIDVLLEELFSKKLCHGLACPFRREALSINSSTLFLLSVLSNHFFFGPQLYCAGWLTPNLVTSVISHFSTYFDLFRCCDSAGYTAK